MTVDELRQKCTDALAHPEWTQGKFNVILRRKWTTQRRMKIAPLRGAPFGEPIADVADGEVLVVFDAQEVLDWLDKNLQESGTA